MQNEFEYYKCSKCGSLQIKNIPDDLDNYYPNNYYSLKIKDENVVKKYLKYLRTRASLGKFTILGFLLKYYYGTPPFIKWFDSYNISPQKDKILDVGCGNGSLLLDMSNAGFKNLIGIDPFIQKDIKYKLGLKIFKGEIERIEEKFNIIMFNHSFEHVYNPLNTLKKVYKILENKGICLIRIPIMDSYAWKKYKTYWVQLDAPRHMVIYSKKGLQILAEKCNLRITNEIFDSNAFQFWGSEQYKEGIPLSHPNSYSINPKKSIFKKRDIKSYEKKARELNILKKGDQACFYLEKIK